MGLSNNAYKRMNLHQLCTFLLEGLDNFNIENDTYENTLRKGSTFIYKKLESIYQNEDELDRTVADLSEALVTYELVYTEIGMKFGARIKEPIIYF